MPAACWWRARWRAAFASALGATIATTKTVLAAIGGLEPLADYLGDDYELGARTAAAGYRVELADIVVETALPDYGFRDFWAHQIRWARNVKDRRPAQYFGLVVTFALVWAVFAVLAAPHQWWTWTDAGRCGGRAVDVGNARWPRRARRSAGVARHLAGSVRGDLVGLAVWVISYFGNQIEWRGLRFKLRQGKAGAAVNARTVPS